MMRWQSPVLAGVLLLGGCGGWDATRESPPAERTTRPATPAEPDGPRVSAYRAPETMARPKPQPKRAAIALRKRAEDQRKAGDHEAAAATLERALRIDPRDASLWNALAHVRLSQWDLAEAADLAAKSNSLAGADEAELRSDNWSIIARARRASGDEAGARRAEAEARKR